MNEPLRYVAILDQHGTNPPTATVLHNTLGGTPTFSRIEPGHYQALLTDGFPDGRTIVSVPPLIDGLDSYGTAVYGSSDHIDILSLSESGQIADGYWNGRWIEITVYPEP